MKIKLPEPFFFEQGKRAVLLLHGFTGNSADVRMLGRYLEKQGYTCYAPQYKGHAAPPEELVKYGPSQWWKDVLMGYDFLTRKGYNEIAVGGLSLGGVFSLKLGYTVPVKGIVTMCSPMTFDNKEDKRAGVLTYAKNFKKREGKTEGQIEQEVARIDPMPTIDSVEAFITEVRQSVHLIPAPCFIAQGRLDEVIDPDSANIMYKELSHKQKELKWYEESGHVITLDKEKEQLHKDVHRFLEQLNWKE